MDNTPSTNLLPLGEIYHGLLLGCALGDSVGLPSEGMSRRRIARWWPGPWRQRFLFGRGMLSDDTEHTLMVAAALAEHPDDAAAFAKALAGKLRWWMFALPAGVGMATARAGIRLWVGFGPERSGVRSAGNGAAMRSAIIGAYFHDRPVSLNKFVQTATRLTHTDDRAFVGALAVARVAAWIVGNPPRARPKPNDLRQLLAGCGTDSEWQRLTATVLRATKEAWSVDCLASELELAAGVSGYVYHTVPVAVFAWWRHRGDFRAGIEAVIRCGGDTDTVAAITGSLFGAAMEQLPADWVEQLVDWPRNQNYIALVAQRLAAEKGNHAQGQHLWLNPIAVIGRNLLFLATVLFHGLRRLLPPY